MDADMNIGAQIRELLSPYPEEAVVRGVAGVRGVTDAERTARLAACPVGSKLRLRGE